MKQNLGDALLLLLLAYTAAHATIILPTNLRINGQPELVFDWLTQRCDDMDIPDSPPRAFIDASGYVNMIAISHRPYRSIGKSLSALKRDCSGPIANFLDRQAPNPATFEGRRWLASPYTVDGKNVFALVHNEFHGQWERMCAEHLRFNEFCWYNSISLAISEDGGKSYTSPSPSSLVFAPPYIYGENAAAFGYFEPSNIIQHSDGYYYVVFQAKEFVAQTSGLCVARTNNLADPSSWRGWDGWTYSVSFINPYLVSSDPSNHVCTTVGVKELGFLHGSISWNERYQRYVMIGEVRGEFYISFTRDFIHWTQRVAVPGLREICESYVPFTTGFCTYPSLLPDSLEDEQEVLNSINNNKRNLNWIEEDSAWVYYIRFMDGESTTRNIYRVKVSFEADF